MRVLPLIVLCSACSGDAAPPVDAGATPPVAEVVARGPSLVVVTLDTTRPDRLGSYGYAAAKTPLMDKMAQQGMRFERAYATVPLTTPSHASMFSGLYPPRHGIRNNGDSVLPDDVTTFAEHAKAAGYRTAASVSAFVTTRVWNLDQGFDAYFDDVRGEGAKGRWAQERPAGRVVDDMVGWLQDPEQGSGPFVIWVHVYDPHHPYQPPPPFNAAGIDPYDGELAYVDSELSRLEAAVDKAAGPAGAHWILVADHGEALGEEHGEQTHGLFVFDPTMRVPFIVRPAVPLAAPVVVSDRTVSGVDVGPTALGLLGLTALDGVDGHNLAPLLTGGAVPASPVYFEALAAQERFGYHPEVGSAEGPWKLIDTPNPRLFDVVADKLEVDNKVGSQPDVEARLRSFTQQVFASAPVVQGDAPAAEVTEQLAALGYVTNDFVGDPEGLKIDAKDRVATIRRLEALRGSSQSTRDFAAIEKEYRQLIADEPQIGEARMGLARALSAQRKEKEAEQVYRDALERQPHSALLRVNLGNTLAAQGRLEEGLAQMRLVLDQVPGDNLAQTGVLRMLTDLQREDEAEQQARDWLELEPDDCGLQAHLGVLLSRRGALDEAEKMLDASFADGVPRQFVHQSLAVVEASRQHPKMAIGHYLKEAEGFGVVPEVHQRIGDLYMSMSEWDLAVDAYRTFVELRPQDVNGQRSLAQAVFNTGDYPEAAKILAPAFAAAPEDPDVMMLQANILAKTDRRDEGAKLAAKANELKRQQQAQQAQQLQSGGAPPPGGGGPGGPPPKGP